VDAQPEAYQHEGMAEGNIILLVFRAILAGSEGIVVSRCVNLKEKLCP